MGQSVSAFCSPREPDSNDQQCCRPRSRHCPAASRTPSDAKDVNANAVTAASVPASRNLLVIVDDEDSPIKKAEYAKSPTVAERIEQELEDELRRRRQQQEETAMNETNIKRAQPKKSNADVANVDREHDNEEAVECRDEVQDVER